jgi:hypothetical protein
MSVQLLQDVLPCDEPLEPVTIRNHVCTLAERLEDKLGDEQASFLDRIGKFIFPIPEAPVPQGGERRVRVTVYRPMRGRRSG